ncbi:MAG: SPOR domain-containing protein [Treponema sp.]|jgi:tetratricopeptide (TPR) repeat protein|nr:SPOR domain-containing protein [Treponema sp.]
MNVTKRILFFAANLAMVFNGALFALDTGASFIADEIRSAASRLELAAISARERHDAYTQLARMLYLSGDIEKAAPAWENAAYSVPEKRDDMALAESAACYVAMGEWEKADAIVKLLMLTVRDDKNVSKRAVYLNSQIEAFRNSNTASLEAVANDPEYISFRPSIYYTLWQVGGKNVYKTKLLTEFPNSPEAYSLVNNGIGSNFVSVLPAAYRLLFPGRELTGIGNNGLTQSRATPAKQPAPAVSKPAVSKTADPKPEARVLQAGLYKDRENADTQAKRLKSSGYNTSVSLRANGGDAYWAVFILVPADESLKTTILNLKKRGFDAFPVQ